MGGTEEVGPSGSQKPSRECTLCLPLVESLLGKASWAIGNKDKQCLTLDWREEQEPQHLPLSACALTAHTPEDRCPAVHPNAGPLSQTTPQVLGRGRGLTGCLSARMTCAAQSPPLLSCACGCVACAHLSPPPGSVHCWPPWDPHLPLAWGHPRSPQPLGPLAGFRSGNRDKVHSLSVWNVTGGVGRGVGNVVASPGRNKHPQQKPRGLKPQIDADTAPSTGSWSAAKDAWEKYTKQGWWVHIMSAQCTGKVQSRCWQLGVEGETWNALGNGGQEGVRPSVAPAQCHSWGVLEGWFNGRRGVESKG